LAAKHAAASFTANFLFLTVCLNIIVRTRSFNTLSLIATVFLFVNNK